MRLLYSSLGTLVQYIIQSLCSAHLKSNQGFQMATSHQRQPCSQPPQLVGFFTSLSITFPALASKDIFAACLLLSRHDEEPSHPI